MDSALQKIYFYYIISINPYISQIVVSELIEAQFSIKYLYDK